jgi:hypothetical protein
MTIIFTLAPDLLRWKGLGTRVGLQIYIVPAIAVFT